MQIALTAKPSYWSGHHTVTNGSILVEEAPEPKNDRWRMANDKLRGELTERPPWRGAAFDRSQTAGVITRKMVALPCVTLGGGSRKCLGAWLLGKFRILEETETLQVVAASRNVRGSRPPRHADYWQSLCFKDRLLTQEGQKRLSSKGAGRPHAPICHLSSVIGHLSFPPHPHSFKVLSIHSAVWENTLWTWTLIGSPSRLVPSGKVT